MIFYEGALSHKDLETMPIYELLGYLEEAEEISRLREAEINKSNGK